MTRFIFYNGDSTNFGNPGEARHYYNYLRGLWKDGSSITYGGQGSNGEVTTTMMYTGHPPEFWSEANIDGAGTRNIPADRRFVVSTHRSDGHCRLRHGWHAAPERHDDSNSHDEGRATARTHPFRAGDWRPGGRGADGDLAGRLGKLDHDSDCERPGISGSGRRGQNHPRATIFPGILSDGRTCFWRTRVENIWGQSAWSGAWSFTTDARVAGEKESDLPRQLELKQNYPNPFNPQTTIRYGLPEGGPVRLAAGGRTRSSSMVLAK